jgi:hypothetical protein
MAMSPDEYAKLYAVRLEQGQRYEDFVKTFLPTVGMMINVYSSRSYQFQEGESPQGAEVKYDGNFSRTGQLWIEVGEKASPRSGDYATSGILRHAGIWLWIEGDYETIYVLAKKDLVAIYERGTFDLVENNTGTSIGFFLRTRLAEGMSLQVLHPNARQHVTHSNDRLRKEAANFLQSMKIEPDQRTLFA